ncbi:hypothetical protein HBM99_13875 [Providencia heimbachae]|uniref:hypothetical protein n=1 Tax=Providencia heimbachae TaxID=333962 RepID=UPI0014198E17|nr:hypothetical protein [Providencia heimbachae]NIH23429.1 hypothetical protein [Providencia heimbachae]
MEFKHTPAPWINVGGWVDAENNGIICSLSAVSMKPEDVDEANANLIAAAPELLEALIELVQSYDKCSIDHNGLCQEHFLQEANDCTFKKANLAISKALGQQ